MHLTTAGALAAVVMLEPRRVRGGTRVTSVRQGTQLPQLTAGVPLATEKLERNRKYLVPCLQMVLLLAPPLHCHPNSVHLHNSCQATAMLAAQDMQPTKKSTVCLLKLQTVTAPQTAPPAMHLAAMSLQVLVVWPTSAQRLVLHCQ
jgi:hypothetical protein